MSADSETPAAYDARVQEYADLVSGGPSIPGLDAFLQAVPQGGKILDLGCGPGNASAAMALAGFDVDAIDASAAMVDHARQTYGLHVCQARFDEIDGRDIYDGIWANFSLLHAPKSALPDHLKALHTAIRPGGVFHIALKLGEGEKRDRLGRFYAYYGEAELDGLLTQAGFTPFASEQGSDKGLEGTISPWIMIRSHG